VDYKNDIPTTSGTAVYKYDIIENTDHLIIRYQRLPLKFAGSDMPDEDMLISRMHIANIPAVVAAIFKVFQTKEGDCWDLDANGDKIAVKMLFNDRGEFNDLIVSDRSRRIRNGLPNQMEFVFEDHLSIHTPLPRTPTPSMIWVTDTLMKIHDEWEK
jgi:hypothetical protein